MSKPVALILAVFVSSVVSTGDGSKGRSAHTTAPSTTGAPEVVTSSAASPRAVAGDDSPPQTTDPATPAQHATVSCQDELHCHCTLGNATVAIQCRFGDKNVHLRWNVLPTRPSPETRFEVDIQTRGTVKVLPSFLDLRLKPTADHAAAMFIIRGASSLDALYASDRTFPTEWHLNDVNVSTLNGEQLSPPPHPLKLTIRHSHVGILRLPSLGPSARLVLNNCSISEVSGLPSPPLQLAPSPEPGHLRPEIIVRKCRMHWLKAGGFSVQNTAGASPPSLLFDQCQIGEMERAAVSVPHQSCQLSFQRNTVQLLHREVFVTTAGSFRIANNTLIVAHASALRGFCGHVSFSDNDVRTPLVFGALHFDKCVQYGLHNNVFNCPCNNVGWLEMFEQRQRASLVEVFYERLYKSSLCHTSKGAISMEEFAKLEDCSGETQQSHLLGAVITLSIAVVLLLLAVPMCVFARRRHIPRMTPVKRARARNIYTSDISGPIFKTSHFSEASRAARPAHTASMSALTNIDVSRSRCGQFLTSEACDDDGIYASIVYKKRRAPAPPPEDATPGIARRSAGVTSSTTLNPRLLNRCVSEGGPARQLKLVSSPTAAVSTLEQKTAPPCCPAFSAANRSEDDDTYLVPDGSACEYIEVPHLALYEEIETGPKVPHSPEAVASTTEESFYHPVVDSARLPADLYVGVISRRNDSPPYLKKTSQDSGIGEDFCTIAEGRDSASLLFCGAGGQREVSYTSVVSSNDVYSPPVKYRAPSLAPLRS